MKIKKKSIIKKILISNIVALILQASIFIGIILYSGILKNLSHNSLNMFEYLLSISFFISILLGVIFAFILGNKITKPIINLVEKVKQIDPKTPLALEKINISEIDDLSLSITNLSDKVIDSASKLSQIINLLNMPIGAFEYKEDEEVVFCTKCFFDVLEIKNIASEAQYINKVVFELIMENLLKDSEIESDGVEICKIKDNKGNQKWIRLKIKDENLKRFGVITDVTGEILEKRRIEYERDHDVLTNLLDRRAFRKIMINKLQECNLGIGAFVMWDLDNLKYVNDTYGHDCGDDYIREAARVLGEFDNYNAIVSRKSGDEFFVFIYGYSSKDEIRKIISQIHKKMRNTVYVISKNKKLRIRASVGIAWYPYDSIDYYELSRYSDFAMYKIKHTVKGDISEFNKEEYNKESFLLKDKEKLNKLIEEELVQYAFQPIVDAHTGEIYAYEALMRSNLETMKSPSQIIKLATAESKLYQIEKLTWFKALEGFVAHKDEFGEAKLFINSIPNYVLSDKHAKEFKERYGEYSSRLVIEFLENERSTSEYTLKKRKFIQDLNAKLAIDDFGSGYNNEATLLDIVPDFVKIDMQIVRGIDKDVNRQHISKNLISYAKKRNIEVIAEGVENKKELETLIELGIDYVQGYYLSKPYFNPPKISEELVQEVIEINYQLTMNN